MCFDVHNSMMHDFTYTLLIWFAREGRELPWRQTRDPYLIWVSEVVLQQTQVKLGIDYYRRFVTQFPTYLALAHAEEDEVLRLWQGLGYYSRARNMLAAARQIEVMGGFPREYAQIRTLRGVGDYIAAAVASFAFDAPYAVVDGNVYRVLARVFGIDTPIDTSRGQKEFRMLAQELLPPQEAANYNQAIMDFGALQCTPHSPDCAACPMAEICVACAENRVGELPVKQRRTHVHDRYFTYLYLRRQDTHVLLQRRGGGDIWEGLYQFPLIESEAPLSSVEVARRFPKGRLTCVASELKHLLSHQRLHAACYVVELASENEVSAAGQWVAEAALDDYAMPRLLERMLEKIRTMFATDAKKTKL